eukprot:scaffold2616_cov124-Skeletonema_menzelii.AAC.1
MVSAPPWVPVMTAPEMRSWIRTPAWQRTILDLGSMQMISLRFVNETMMPSDAISGAQLCNAPAQRILSFDLTSSTTSSIEFGNLN